MRFRASRLASCVVFTCENDRRCVWSLRCELLGSGGRRRRGLIRHLWTRAEVTRVVAA